MKSDNLLWYYRRASFSENISFIRIFIKLERESRLRERLWIKGASISLALSRVEKWLLPRLSWISRLHGVSFFTQDRRTDESPEIISSFLFLNCRNSFVKKINLRDVFINVHIYNGLNLVFRAFWDKIKIYLLRHGWFNSHLLIKKTTKIIQLRHGTVIHVKNERSSCISNSETNRLGSIPLLLYK